MQPFRATIRWLCRVAEAIAIAALIAVTALIMVQIGAREIFNAGLSWADELARYAGLIVIFMGVPALSVRDEHVKVDMFLNMMPASPRRVFAISNDVLMVLFCAMFVYAGLAVPFARGTLLHAGARDAEPDLVSAGDRRDAAHAAGRDRARRHGIRGARDG